MPQDKGPLRGISAGQRCEGDDFKKISAWAADMNFDQMPELHWTGGYPFTIGLMAIVCTGLYMIFKRRDWL
ncbi:CorA family divalent cation transporter [Streptomyces sp. NPDC059104]|uniref:CorA family divalent cation transporter n=1 Tax=Streptomyces sp. NPDC059104 TaxID=3346729 RepID=UPI0036A86EC9